MKIIFEYKFFFLLTLTLFLLEIAFYEYTKIPISNASCRTKLELTEHKLRISQLIIEDRDQDKFIMEKFIEYKKYSEQAFSRLIECQNKSIQIMQKRNLELDKELENLKKQKHN